MSKASDSAKGSSALVDALVKESPRYWYEIKDITSLSNAKAIIESDEETQLDVLRECVKRIGETRARMGKDGANPARLMNLHHEAAFPVAAAQLAARLLKRALPLADDDWIFLADHTSDLEMVSTFCVPYLSNLVAGLERHAEQSSVSTNLKKALQRLAKTMEWTGRAVERKLCSRLELICGERTSMPLQAGEAWSDQAIADITSTSQKEKDAWLELLDICCTAEGAAPSAKWRDRCTAALKRLKPSLFKRRVLKWVPLVSRPRTQPIENWSEYLPDPNQMIIDPHMQVLKGLAWACGMIKDEEICRALGDLARTAYKKIPKIGPRAVKVGNACVHVLGAVPELYAVGQLGVLRARVKFGSAQKMIEKAFNAAAERLGMSRDDIEELGVPTYGLEEVGIRRETLGEFTAELKVDGRDVSINWSKSDGKVLKSVPAAVKARHKDDFKELQAAAKDIAAMLPAQSERLDSMFLLQKRWPIASWRQRYLDHPLVGTIARRIIWTFTEGKTLKARIWHDGRLLDVHDKPFDPSSDSQVQLWHPIGRPMDEVLAWRAWLDRHQVRQPFKQAHREVYLLTDAERRTETYSNRFAAHVLRQHQFNALCAARGWKNKLRLMVDDSYPPASRDLPIWGLRAEFWIEGIGDNYGVDTNDSGAFLRVSTDQVRFYRMAAASNLAHAGGGSYTMSADGPGANNINTPLPLENVPPLVLSEIMRDVDLFVGVASVGNDPTWQDGGPEGRFRTYWHGYSFGELSQTAQTRRAVLETLVPRLTKIRDRCALSDRFLVVKGDIRTYKIHLGSGNILMEPNDQYLCIVPSRPKDQSPDVFLPFEGDATLSIILSKAFLLADDKKIKDPTIVRQISPKD